MDMFEDKSFKEICIVIPSSEAETNSNRIGDVRIEMTNAKAKRLTSRKALKLLGIDVDTLSVTDKKIFTKKDAKEIADKLRSSIWSLYRVKLSKQPFRALGQLARLHGFEMQRYGKEKDRAIVDTSSLETLRNFIDATVNCGDTLELYSFKK